MAKAYLSVATSYGSHAELTVTVDLLCKAAVAGYALRMNRPLRLGIIGTGVAARELYWPAFKELRGTIELVACANRTRRKAVDFAKLARVPRVTDTAEELLALPEVEAVLLSLPIDLLPKYVLLALRAGKAVLSEKPLAPSVAEGRKLLRAAAKFETPWLVGENYAFMSQVRQLRTWIEQRRLGEVRVVEARQLTKMDSKNPYFKTRWRESPGHVGGFVVDGGVHVAHIVRSCFGMPELIGGTVASFDPKLPPIDTALAVLRFGSGAVGTWTSCFSARYDGPAVKIYGSKANAELAGDTVTLIAANGHKTVHKMRRNSFTAEFEHFADVVRNGLPPAYTPEEALLDLVLVESLCNIGSRHQQSAR